MNRLYIAVMALVAAASAWAAPQTVLSPRTAVALREGAAPAARSASDDMVSAYLTIDTGMVDADDLRAMGVDVVLDLGSTLTARLPLNRVSDLAEVPGVRYIQTSTPVAQMLDVASPEVGADAVRAGRGLDSPYTGAGVVVGVVDKGFDYTHPAFYAPDGTLRIRRVWEQAATPSGSLSSPQGYGYGTELTTAADIEAGEGDARGNSHGTHVTSIAAGSDSYLDGVLCGMAPDADIVLVSMLDDGGGNVTISDAISYIFGYADSVGKPCVVNLSLGAHHGPHDGTSTFDVIADALQGPGRLIVGSAGNHRTGNFHVSHDFKGADDAPLRTFIDYKTSLSDKNAGGEIDIWADKDVDMEVALLVYRVSNGSVSDRVVVYPASGDVLTDVAPGRNVTGKFVAVSETSPLNDKAHVLLTSYVTGIRAGYAVAIEVTPKTAGKVDLWGDNTKIGLTSRDIDGFTGPAGESTICEIGGTARRILTVGAYTTRSSFMRLGEESPIKIDETDGALSSFSSNGPTADGRLKPQVSAPGCMISAAVSNFDNSGTAIYSQYYKDTRGRDCFYGYMQGTSMSSPMVAGIVATWLQAWPDMTPEDLLQVIRSTARADEHTGPLPDGDNDWGYGKVDALSGLKECIAKAGSGGIGSVAADTGAPVRLLAAATDAVTVLFTADVEDVTIDMYAIDGSHVCSKRLGGAGASDTVSMPAPVAGVYLINVTADGDSAQFKAVVR